MIATSSATLSKPEVQLGPQSLIVAEEMETQIAVIAHISVWRHEFKPVDCFNNMCDRFIRVY